MILDPLQDGKSCIELISSMGSDLDIVNDARASFEKSSSELSDKDIKLIHYLIKHQHTSPFRGVVFKFKVKAPLYVCRQWWKHVVASNHVDDQLGWNEKSFRYIEVEDDSDFYVPDEFRQQSTTNKQGSEGVVESGVPVGLYVGICLSAWDTYKKLLSYGVCREQARGVLAPAFYTSWVWTVSLQALLHFIGLRKGHGAQSEIAAYAVAIEELIKPIVPVTLAAWNEHHNGGF